MNRSICCRLLILVCFKALSGYGQQPGKTVPSNSSGFTENKGQIADMNGKPALQALFKVQGREADVYITTTGLTYLCKKYGPVQDGSAAPKARALEWSSMRMILAHASIKVENVFPENPVPGYSNYYYSFCPKGITHVLTYGKVTIKNIYPHIDWVLSAREHGELEYDFIVHPGGRPGDIRMKYEGVKHLESKGDADKLNLYTDLNVLHEGKLKAFQLLSGAEIPVRYQVKGNEVCFLSSAYDKTETLVIDPPLAWDVTYGSGSYDEAYGAVLAGDATSDLLLTGETDGAGFPTTAPAQAAFGGGGADAFVGRYLNATGARVFSTYIGGNTADIGRGIGSDNSGNAYVTGSTAGSFPVTSGAYNLGATDIWAAKFTAAGALTWAFYYGGSGADAGNAITTDAAGDSYITGNTASPNGFFTGTVGSANINDVFVLKLNNAGTKQYAVRHGGNDNDVGRAIALNGTSLYVTGSTFSANFPVTAGVFQTTATTDIGNTEDAFILKVDEPTGATRQFSTYLGGDFGDDQGQGITVDGSGNVYVTGYTISTTFPTLNPGAPAYFAGASASPGVHDAFVFECNGTATTKSWSTYFGGGALDIGYAIGLDGSNGVCITGATGSTNLPTQAPSDVNYYQAAEGDGGTTTDAFIAFFNSTKQLKWSTYYGGAGQDEGRGLALDASSNLYIGGMKNQDVMPLKFTAGTVLPVEFSNFTGRRAGERNLLEWTTSSETDNRYFIIERTADGHCFDSLTWINGAGSSSSAHSYNAYDEHPLSGTNYYRICQKDDNGNGSCSSIIAIQGSETGNSGLLYPNPATDFVQCIFISMEEGAGELEVADATGRICLTKIIAVHTGSNTEEVETSVLSPGIYLLKMVYPGHILQKKFRKD